MSELSLAARLWLYLGAALAQLRASLPVLLTLAGRERRMFSAWLGALESMARKTVLIEAVALAPELSPIAAHTRKPAPSPPTTHNSTRPKPPPALRLWPRPRRGRARVRWLGPPTSLREIWREQRRAALIARLKAARLHRKPAHVRMANRIDALERLIAAPLRAVRRLARKLTARLVRAMAARRAPRSPHVHADAQRACEIAAFRVGAAFDSS